MCFLNLGPRNDSMLLYKWYFVFVQLHINLAQKQISMNLFLGLVIIYLNGYEKIPVLYLSTKGSNKTIQVLYPWTEDKTLKETLLFLFPSFPSVRGPNSIKPSLGMIKPTWTAVSSDSYFMHQRPVFWSAA